MIQARTLILDIRHKEKDNNEILYSDYDILAAVNECLRYLNQAYALRNSDFLERSTVLQIDNELDGFELPADFVSLVNVSRNSDGYVLHPVRVIGETTSDSYKVVDNRLYTRNKEIVLAYRRKVLDIKNIEDSIDMPELFRDNISKVTRMILNNAETDVLLKAVNDTAKGIVSSRKYSNVRKKMPFYC